SLDCFVAILIEHFAGNFSVWMAPVQARVITVGDRLLPWAREAFEKMLNLGLRVELDESNEKLGAKIRDAQLVKVPYTLVIGDKEVDGKGVSPRRHGEGKEADLGFQTLDAFAARLSAEAASPY